ncbi:phage N-6-adenine-methyltransferase [Neorhizobium petrolearium]|uniref:Phage N-6-adenine-methyltransferase n=1 Tax=Neorhizobium petrolearium TaxID=515361 RepID=A0ABY8M275_9HYPH|nr:phage N-6-adenine-methyltransferase [Neorhizobium petrolearium]MCC2608371.1 phage N-6-adenine-methyltransferase [Neorhizobium petrolearium]WGI68650.1 phage N-6-adenine-methyltransferase [Neorhizobium petrolearium]
MTIGSHQRTVGKSQTHLTPPFIIHRLGPFDLDPCAALGQPWATAKRHFTIEDDGLSQPWGGRVWLNPPFDRYQVGRWIGKLAEHGNGICLVHARTEADWFRPIWERADAILFLADRLHFHTIDGKRQPANSGAPIVLAAFGEANAMQLAACGLPGFFVTSTSRVGGQQSLREMELAHE